ncbi:MAG: lipopolysaccharide heptosyltransferase II [Deltaproteobacteria bacterium]|nr:lipopolysaccharide heptosyltransferase II [Deltaproteobacteria bacterium]
MADALWQRVLLVQTSFLGDTVLTLPLIAEIKRRFPAAHLAVLCNPAGYDILQNHPAIDELIVDDKRRADRGLSGLRRQAQQLKEKSFSLAMTPHKSLRTALLLWLAQIPHRVGFAQSAGWFLFHARAQRDPAQHDVVRNLAVLTPLGIKPEDCRQALHLPVGENLREKVAAKLAGLGYDSSLPAIGINPGSVWPMKRWSAAGFAQVVEQACREYHCQAIIFGGPEDRETATHIAALCQAKLINSAGVFSLTELPAAISFCKLFITNDSGPMHIAVARNIPTVAIFCATTPDLGFYPYSSNAIVVEKRLHCRPCSAHGGRRCPLGSADCVRLIEPALVLAAVRKLMDRQAREGAAPAQPFTPEFLSV